MSENPTPSLERLLSHRGWVQGVARRLLRDEQAAEDLAQEAWVRAMRSPPDSERDPRPWLRRVLKSLASNALRSEGRRQKREGAWRTSREHRSPDVLVAEAEQHKRLVNVLMDLEEPFKTVLILRFYEGLGPKEIAERLEIPVGTVNSRIARAVERMKTRLDEEENGNRRAWIAGLLPLSGLDRYAPAAAATATTTSLTGVLIVTLSKPKFALVALLLVGCLVGGAFWLAADTPGADRQIPPSLDAANDRAPALKGRSASLRASPVSVRDEATPTTDPHVVRGRVVDARGAPVEQAEVFLLPRGAAGASAEELRDPELGRLRTGADGGFAIRVGDLSGVRLVAYAAGHLPASVEPADVGDGPIELVLGDPWQLTVHLSDAGGRWPRGCEMRVTTDFDKTFERAADPAVQAFLFDTDPWDVPDEPRVVIPVTTRARLLVEVRPPASMAAVPAVQYVEHPQVEARVRLIRSGSLHLRLVDETTGTSIAHGVRTSVVIRDESTGAIAHSVSTIQWKDVAFDSGFAPGRYVVELGVEGYSPQKQVVEFRDVGERLARVARLVPSAGDDSLGRVILQIVDPHRTSEVLRTLLDSGAKAGLADKYQVLVRRTGGDAWIDALPGELGGERVELRPLLIQREQPGLRPGTWDLFVARRDTGTAAFLRAVRVFSDQENVIDVTLEPGTAFRLPQVAGEDARFADLRVSTKTAGDLPPILWTKDGSNSITGAKGIAWLLRLPRKPVVLGPFPGPEVEVRLTGEDGTVRTVRVRGAGIVDRPSAKK